MAPPMQADVSNLTNLSFVQIVVGKPSLLSAFNAQTLMMVTLVFER
jgi:hypothetical protein